MERLPEGKNGLDCVSLDSWTSINESDIDDDDSQTSDCSSSTDGSSTYGGESGDNVSYIEVVDKSDSTYHIYNVYYYTDKISTTVTDTASVVDQWIAHVYKDFHSKLDNLVVGFDIEWRRAIQNQVSVLQLCVSHRCLIFQLSCCDKIPKSLSDFLSNDKFIFVGRGINSEAHKLEEDHGLVVARKAELGILAAWHLTTNNFIDFIDSEFHVAELKELAKDVLGQELPKRRYIQMSNWDKEFLSDEQIEHACLDAFVASKIAINAIKAAEQFKASKPESSAPAVPEPPQIEAEARQLTEPAEPVVQQDAPKKSYASIVKVWNAEPPVSAPVTTIKVKLANVKAHAPAAPSPAHGAPAPNNNNACSNSMAEEVKGHSIYIKNLPLGATPEQVEKEFKSFGPIKPVGVQIISNEGFCFGYVEFEQLSSMQNAIKAGMITIANRNVFIEEKRTTALGKSFFSGRGWDVKVLKACDEENVDETGLVPKDIELVMAQTGASRAKAAKALKANDGDIISAIMTIVDSTT